PGAPRPGAHRPGRADRRAGRHHRRGEDHAGQARDPVLRPVARTRAPRRRGHARAVLTGAAQCRRHGHPGELPLLRDDRRQHPVRSPRRDPRRRRPGHQGARSPRLHHRDAGRLRHRRGQPGRPAQRGSAAAGRLRPGLPRRPRRADPRRGDVVARHTVRAPRPTSAAHGAGRPYGGDHRPPAVDGRDRRPGAGHGARAHHRGRHARRAGVRRLGQVLRPAPGVAGVARL
ncbi:MAG: Heterodimeric efflux ABC transporter, permease/ATP-binding subunit 2, partial [uncultured Nocardioidaceae bacterium]